MTEKNSIEAFRTFVDIAGMIIDKSPKKAVLAILQIAYKEYGKELFWQFANHNFFEYLLEE